MRLGEQVGKSPSVQQVPLNETGVFGCHGKQDAWTQHLPCPCVILSRSLSSSESLGSSFAK